MVGIIHPSVAEAFGLKRRHVAAFDCSLAALVDVLPGTELFRPFRRFPTVSRDVAFFIPDGLSAASIEQGLREVGGELLIETAIFDRYAEPPEDGRSRVSLALRLIFGAVDRTLVNSEIDTIMARLDRYLEQDLKAEIRRE